MTNLYISSLQFRYMSRAKKVKILKCPVNNFLNSGGEIKFYKK